MRLRLMLAVAATVGISGAAARPPGDLGGGGSPAP
jgi:hypothetical protein